MPVQGRHIEIRGVVQGVGFRPWVWQLATHEGVVGTWAGSTVGMVAAEFFLSSTGLSQVIMVASQNFDTGSVYGMILIIGLIGVGLTRLGQSIENRFARWRN